METRGKPVETLAYVAGVVDSDGCIGITRAWPSARHQIKYGAKVSVTNVDQPLVEWLKSEFGGYITIRPKAKEHHKTTYTWQISEQKMAIFLKQIVPYLRVKKTQAELMIELKAGVNRELTKTFGITGRGGGMWVPAEEMKRRENIYERIKALNDDRRPHRLTDPATRTVEVIVSADGKPSELGGTETTQPLLE